MKILVDIDAGDQQVVKLDTKGPVMYPNDGNEMRVELDCKFVKKHKKLCRKFWRSQKKLFKLFDERIELLFAREREERENGESKA
jgi:hypothetical protein